ncbi:MAG TPA: FMN-binding protein [Candidatus Lachnoclostridium stercorigallinarum]|uniref:FMN-binding protein n=1 Tax=Candidatus Lachnoclostridium stercorigallinarum TaxID=2838634 RepID=A0A9D2K794_9FIRM|nr:FMN-binding protein [Candidatus Lachnoclostridium stercorigallinarum]
MDKGNLIGIGVMAAASAALVAVAGPAYDSLQQSRLEEAAGGEEIVTVTGEGEGYGGVITAEVTVAGDKILDLKLTGEGETPEIGGTALSSLQEAIVANQSLDGVEAVTGATWTSNGAFDAIRSAMGEETQEESEAAEQEEVQAAGLTHGLGIYSTGRLGPGSDDQGAGVYSINEVAAYVLFDSEGRIVDLEVDQLEVATPNYDGAGMPDFTGFPGQSYNADEDHDAVVDTVWEQTEEDFLAQVESWQTKRQRGDSYKLNSGTWEEEMDIFEEAFKGMTVEELEQWYEKYCSDVNGRPLFGTSEDEQDVAKYEALTEEEKNSMDAVSGATMSLNDAHGNILGAIVKAYDNRRPVEGAKIAKIGLGFTNTGRLGPGSDDQGTAVYSFNTQAVGACYDEEGKIVSLYTDVMEVATPNYDGATMPNFTGFPGQSYNADEDHDAVVDAVWEQTEEDFLAQVEGWQTKRERGDSYKLNSGTWEEEMDIFEDFFAGMTTEEVSGWYASYCSDVSGRPLFGTSENEEDVAKYDGFTEEEKSAMDAVSGATMSLRDAHGDILGAIENAWANAKDTNITVAE